MSLRKYHWNFSVLFVCWIISCLNSDLIAQTPQQEVEPCAQHHLHKKQMMDPDFAKKFEQEQIQLKELERQLKSGSNANKRGTIYRIPVVFHVLHLGGPENISQAQIEDAVRILNRDFRRLNPDTSVIDPAFKSLIADVELEFVLATKAPDGTCFNGVTRTYTPWTVDPGKTVNEIHGYEQVLAATTGNDVYQGIWPHDKYLNFFVCKKIPAGGYTFLPHQYGGQDPTEELFYNSVVILHDYTGSIGTSIDLKSRALTHEVGHWLNLSHAWGNLGGAGCDGTSTNPADPCFGIDNCDDDDGVEDTPNCRGVTTCNTSSNTCDSDDAYWGKAMKDNVENYMEYSYCSKMFTPGQATRMRTALVSNLAGRNKLWKTDNLVATGVFETAGLCKAAFSTPRTEICSGETIQFTDESHSNPTNWSWSFPGGTPSTSTEKSPTVTYNIPGIYQVNLTATDGTTSDTEVKTKYITVYAAGEGIPFYEGFENMANFDGASRWHINNLGNDNTWGIVNNVGHTGKKSAKLSNFNQISGGVDELVSGTIDLSGIKPEDGVTLSFRYAYRKMVQSNDEFLRVSISNNCSDVWELRKTIHGSNLSNTYASYSWSPTKLEDWVTVHVPTIFEDYWVDDFRFKFNFKSDGGNNLFLDDINIYSGKPSETIVLGLENETAIQQLELFPNPANDEVTLRFYLESDLPVIVKIIDVLGHQLEEQRVFAKSGNNLIFLKTNQLSGGTYFLDVTSGIGDQVIPLIIK